jgi:hypothetical protein
MVKTIAGKQDRYIFKKKGGLTFFFNQGLLLRPLKMQTIVFLLKIGGW